jgi:hypothetical protein
LAVSKRWRGWLTRRDPNFGEGNSLDLNWLGRKNSGVHRRCELLWFFGGVCLTFSTSKNVVVNDIFNLLTLSGLGKVLTLTEGITTRQVR